MARTPLRPDDPTRIGHYRLTARLGSGGMGVVYLGVSWDGGQVAVKVLRPELADDPEFRHRFGREVAALMRVKGVCTVRVIEADTESPRPFVVTEYAPGPSLSEYIDKHGSVDPDMLFGLATGLAEALTTIHAAGIVHRDLKPSNIILTDAGPKVIDFGIARRQDTRGVTKTGMMIGSLGFMAPEQISGRPGPEADVFAWGVTVAYAATGRSPFGAGNSHSILYRVMYGDPDIASVPDSLLPLVEASLAKDPQQPADRAAVAGPADERLQPPRERQRHAHPGHPGADLAERVPPEPAACQQASGAGPGSSSPASGARSLAARGAPGRIAGRRTAARCVGGYRNAYRRPAGPGATVRRGTARRGTVRHGAGRRDAGSREDTGQPPDGHHRRVGASRHASPPPQPPGGA